MLLLKRKLVLGSLCALLFLINCKNTETTKETGVPQKERLQLNTKDTLQFSGSQEAKDRLMYIITEALPPLTAYISDSNTYYSVPGSIDDTTTLRIVKLPDGVYMYFELLENDSIVSQRVMRGELN